MDSRSRGIDRFDLPTPVSRVFAGVRYRSRPERQPGPPGVISAVGFRELTPSDSKRARYRCRFDPNPPSKGLHGVRSKRNKKSHRSVLPDPRVVKPFGQPDAGSRRAIEGMKNASGTAVWFGGSGPHRRGTPWTRPGGSVYPRGGSRPPGGALDRLGLATTGSRP
jgi:hypothetical protein